MTTTQDTPTISQMLVKRREELDHYQTTAADAIGVSRNSYRQWETGHSVPEDTWVPNLMAYLEMSEEEIVLTLYQSRKARDAHNRGSVDWFRRPIDISAKRPVKVAA